MHLQYLKRFYPDFKNKKILELGCGKGEFLLECHKENLDVVGVDINPNYIEISKEKIKKSGFEPHIILTKGEKLPFKDNSFDFINCVEVLEHTNDPEQVLKECFRMLKNNGQIYITIHNRLGFKDAHYNLRFLNWMPRFLGEKYIKLKKKNKDKFQFLDKQKISEMHYYTYKKFTNIVTKIGFNIKDTKKIQLQNPEIILNKKFKRIVFLFQRFKISFISDWLYKLLNKLYFNTFHLILIKK